MESQATYNTDFDKTKFILDFYSLNQDFKEALQNEKSNPKDFKKFNSELLKMEKKLSDFFEIELNDKAKKSFYDLKKNGISKDISSVLKYL